MPLYACSELAHVRDGDSPEIKSFFFGSSCAQHYVAVSLAYVCVNVKCRWNGKTIC